MSNYSFNMDRESVTFVINDLMARRRNLNDWERKFITDIHQHYIVENKFMSDKQYETLSKLWEKY